MIDKYCVYIYSLHYVQREYIYHTTNRREEGTRTPRTHRLRSLEKRWGCSDVSPSTPLVKLQLTILFYCIYNHVRHLILKSIDYVRDLMRFKPVATAHRDEIHVTALV